MQIPESIKRFKEIYSKQMTPYEKILLLERYSRDYKRGRLYIDDPQVNEDCIGKLRDILKNDL